MESWLDLVRDSDPDHTTKCDDSTHQPWQIKMAARFGRQDYEYEEKDPSDRGNFHANHNSTPSQHQHNSHLGHQDHFSQDYDYRGEQEEYIFTTSPTENEKSTSMVSLFDMRNDAAFCDVAFLVHGCLFRAHKVIVSSWSRWMYALLSEGSEQEIISLDIFTPAEFGAILDYMYGQPLEFTLQNAEPMFKIIRRLEMKPLEQKCWKFLLSIIDAHNCERLHQLADFFDCTPLKLTAWRVIQENKPGYSTAPAEILQALSGAKGGASRATATVPRKRFIGHGLIGPGERMYDANYQDQGRGGAGVGGYQVEESDDDDDDEGSVSIFNTTVSGGGGSGGDAGEGLLSSGQKRFDFYVRPDQLPKGTPAKEVVRAWAFRLQQVYQECCEQQGMSPERAQQMHHSSAAATQRGGPGGGQHGGAKTSSPLSRQGSAVSQQTTKRNLPPMVNRMPSLDRLSDISDPPQQQDHTPTQRSTPQRASVRPSVTAPITPLSIGSGPTRSAGGGGSGIANRGSILSHSVRGGAGGQQGYYPETIDEKETDSVSTEEKDVTGYPQQHHYATPASKQPFQSATPASRASVLTPASVSSSAGGAVSIDWKDELRKFYISRGLTDKLDSLDTILSAWEGKEKDMIEALYGKYQMKIPSDLQEKLVRWEEIYGGGDSESQSER